VVGWPYFCGFEAYSYQLQFHEGLKHAKVLVPGRPFQPSLMFVSKDRAYLCEAPFWCSTLEYAADLNQQTLGVAGKTFQGTTLKLITNIHKLLP